MRYSTILFILFLYSVSAMSFADDNSCKPSDYPCLFKAIEGEAQKTTETRWRNQIYRDLAVSKSFNGQYDDARDTITKIDSSDTQAMTIRAIGMALAIHKDLSDSEYKMIFAGLIKSAEKIIDSGAKDIAYTYIAMAQAFAGLDDDATNTTDQMTNPALKYKAFGETAEIQAERGDYSAAMRSINAINSTAFKNKSLSLLSVIFIKQDNYDYALKCAMQISNSTKKANSIQKIINAQQGLNKK